VNIEITIAEFATNLERDDSGDGLFFILKLKIEIF
jgi:hypothetical protein